MKLSILTMKVNCSVIFWTQSVIFITEKLYLFTESNSKIEKQYPPYGSHFLH